MLQPARMTGHSTALRASATLCLLAFLLAMRLTAHGESKTKDISQRLSRTNLMVFRSGKGAVLPVRSVRDWRKRRDEILRGMQEIMGPLPGKERRCPLDVKIEEEVDCGDYIRRFLTYASESGC